MNIGKSLPRREDANLITGAGVFVDDLKPDAVTYARFVRSSVAHARILGVDTTAARQCDGVRRGARLRQTSTSRRSRRRWRMRTHDALPRPMLARDVVRFVGEPVAVVVAESRRAGRDCRRAGRGRVRGPARGHLGRRRAPRRRAAPARARDERAVRGQFRRRRRRRAPSRLPTWCSSGRSSAPGSRRCRWRPGGCSAEPTRGGSARPRFDPGAASAPPSARRGARRSRASGSV